MHEWWTYGIADLVLFTPETYFRLFEFYHRNWWPMQLVCLAMAVVILLCLWLKPAWGGRVIAILLGALLAMPATAHLTGREWMQAELFAMTPDATALATLGLLLLTKGRVAVWLVVIPVLWCFVTGATLWVLEAPEAMILPAGAVLTIALMLLPVRRRE